MGGGGGGLFFSTFFNNDSHSQNRTFSGVWSWGHQECRPPCKLGNFLHFTYKKWFTNNLLFPLFSWIKRERIESAPPPPIKCEGKKHPIKSKVKKGLVDLESWYYCFILTLFLCWYNSFKVFKTCLFVSKIVHWDFKSVKRSVSWYLY